jgi:glycosyltransferase involved in cell wall biosynthesis
VSVPKISVVVCTYNGASLIEACLSSILKQAYPSFEVLCLDGRSEDNTQDIIRRLASQDPRIRLVINPNRLPEGKGNGKWLGFQQADGEIFGIIDQDNVLQRTDLFRKVAEAFDRFPDAAGVLGGLNNDHKDTPVVRYVALFGTDSFFAYRSLDFLRTVEARAVTRVDADFESAEMQSDNLSLTGGNCFFYTKASVTAVGGYDQDVLVVQRLVQGGKRRVVIVMDATKHYAEQSLRRLVTKKFFWARKFFSGPAVVERFNYLPRTQREFGAFSRNVGFNLLVVPNLFYALRAFRRSHDPVSFLFPVLAFLNTVAYGFNFLSHAIAARFQKRGPKSG